MTVDPAPGPIWVDIYLNATDVAVINLPSGTDVRVHCDGNVHAHHYWQTGSRMIAMAPGDPDRLGWSVPIFSTDSLHNVRNNGYRRDRGVWGQAADLVASGGVVYVEHELRDYYGRQVWRPVRVRLPEPERAPRSSFAPPPPPNPPAVRYAEKALAQILDGEDAIPTLDMVIAILRMDARELPIEDHASLEAFLAEEEGQ